MDNIGLCPGWLHLGHLSEGDTSTAGCGQIDVLCVAVGDVFALCVLQDYGHFIVVLPDASHLHAAGLESGLELCRSAVDAQLGAGHGIQRYVHDGVRMVKVGMHPFQFRNLPELAHQCFRCCVYAVQIVAVETVFVSGHIEEVHLLEPAIGLGPMVAVFGGVFVQHVKSALNVGGVHDELCEVSSSHLRGVANLEAGR